LPYTLPSRALQSEDPLDPKEFNDEIHAAAEKRSGMLDEHDFDAGIQSSLIVAEGAYYVHRYIGVSADPEFGAPGAFSRPTRTNGEQIPTHGGWAPIPDLTWTRTTGVAVLNIIARFQYIWFLYHAVNGWNPGSVSGPSGASSAVQFCIAVDGRVIESTITGNRDIQRRPPWAIQAQSPQRDYAGGSLRPGGFQPRSERCNALGPYMGSVRIGTLFPVTPGSHVIEVYCRRLLGFDGSTATTTDHGIFIYNRQAFIQVLNVIPASAQTFDGVEIDALESEDEFNEANMITDRVSALAAAFNAIPAGALARGAFNHNHLPSAILDWAQVSTLTGAASPTTDDYYPGWDTATLAGAATGDTGWWLLQDGTGAPTDLRTDEIGAHPLVFDMTLASTFLVLANVHVRHIENVPDEVHCFGALSIMYRPTGGAAILIPESEAYICNWNHWGESGGINSLLNEETDVPLMAVVSLPAGSPDIDWFGVFGCAFDDNNNRAELEYGRGNLTVFQYRDEVTT